MTESNSQWKETLATRRLCAALDVPAALVEHVHGAGQEPGDIPRWIVIHYGTYVHTKQREIVRKLTAMGLLAYPGDKTLALPTVSVAPEMYLPDEPPADASLRYLYDTREPGRDIVFHAATPDKVLLCTGEHVDNPGAWQDWRVGIESEGSAAGKLEWFMALVSGAACHKCRSALRHSADVAVVWLPASQRPEPEPAEPCRDLYAELERALAAVTDTPYPEFSDVERIHIAGIALENVIAGGDEGDLIEALRWYEKGKKAGVSLERRVQLATFKVEP